MSFKLFGELPPIYQFHCSLCRKVSGSSSNSALVIDSHNFTWCSGLEYIRSFVTPSGFKSDFCAQCGCPVPNVNQDGKTYWVPAGLLSESVISEVLAHVYINSKANWDTACMSDNIAKFAIMPSEDEWLKLSENGCKEQ
ncbi:GFA family protein [Shewanella sp. 1CM18E]|uniref:GFA family protein n=1 Tax=Shewanella sp. 1CM18E TaxID=2929169 RepID=UPI0020BE7D26|nr:GFA family protein [Shewanella sp. 1CM18E]